MPNMNLRRQALDELIDLYKQNYSLEQGKTVSKAYQALTKSGKAIVDLAFFYEAKDLLKAELNQIRERDRRSGLSI